MYYVAKRNGGFRTDQMMQPHEILANNRVLFLYGPVAGMTSRSDPFSSNIITDTLLALSIMDAERPIYIIIDSPGGSVVDGYNLIDAMKTIKAPVRTVGRVCYSMAAVILSAGQVGFRYLFPSARVMLHLSSATIGGDAATLQIQHEEVQKTQDILITTLLENGVKRTRKQLLKDMDREKWLTAQEAIEYGLADRIVEPGMLERVSVSNTDEVQQAERAIGAKAAIL